QRLQGENESLKDETADLDVSRGAVCILQEIPRYGHREPFNLMQHIKEGALRVATQVWPSLTGQRKGVNGPNSRRIASRPQVKARIVANGIARVGREGKGGRGRHVNQLLVEDVMCGH